MTQRRITSLAESLCNVAVGWIVSMALIATVLPAFGYRVSASDGFWMSIVFTIASIVRSYLLRRAFNRAGKVSQ